MTEWRFVWSHGDDHETGHALSREMLALYRDKNPQKRDIPPCPGTENRAVYALAVFPAVQ